MPSSRVGLEGDGIFPLTRSLPWVVILLDMKRNCVLLSVDKVCFSSHLSVTLLLTEPWNSLSQASMETKWLVIFQEKQGLFPEWELAEWQWMGQKKLSPPNWWTPSASKEGNLRLAWIAFAVIPCAVSPTRVCSTRSYAHLEKILKYVCKVGESCWKIFAPLWFSTDCTAGKN